MLLGTYSWKGAMWIISGLALNGLVFAALYRPLSYTLPGDEDAPAKVDDELGLEDETSKPLFNMHLQTLKTGSPIYRCRSLEACNKLPADKSADIARLGHSLFLDSEPRSRKHAKGRHIMPPLERKDIFYSGSVRHLPEYARAGNEENYVRSMLSIHADLGNPHASTADSNCRTVFAEMFDFSLLKSPTFVLYLLSCFLCMIGKWRHLTFLMWYGRLFPLYDR